MSDQKRVKIRYKPRDQFRPFHSRKQRWSALVCHRRAGKTVATLNDLIRGQSTSVSPRVAYDFHLPAAQSGQRHGVALFAALCRTPSGELANEFEMRVDLVNGSMICS